MKLNNWLDIWLNKYTKHVIKLKTFTRYSDIINKHINPVLADAELNQLTGEILQNFVLFKLNHGNLNTNGKLANNTVLGIVSVLKQALRSAVILGMTDKEYTADIKLPPATEKTVEAFERNEQKRLESFCIRSKPNYIGIIICLYTGIRLGELLALTWEDIDFKKSVLSVNKTAYTIKHNGKNFAHIDIPKTKSSIRFIPLNKSLAAILNNRNKQARSKYIITTKYGGIVQNRSYQKSFKYILKKCNIQYKNFHALRHTFATRALELGMDVKTLSEILGHKSPVITLNRYSHSMTGYKIEMMNKVGRLLEVK